MKYSCTCTCIIIVICILAAIVLQIMELVADKKGIDKSAFLPIRADLDKMKIALGGGNGLKRPPSSSEQDPKRPRI